MLWHRIIIKSIPTVQITALLLQICVQVVLYSIHQMDSVVNSSYILVYVHTLVGAESDVAEFCLKQLFTVTDNRSVNFHQLYMCSVFAYYYCYCFQTVGKCSPDGVLKFNIKK